MQPVQKVCEIIESTFSINNELRDGAEEQLRVLQKDAGFCPVLLEICHNKGLAANIRTSAGVQLKNIVSQNWSSENSENLPEQARKFITKELFKVIVAEPQQVLRNPLLEALRIISQHDYPERLPHLLPAMIEHLNKNDFSTVFFTLQCMKEVCKAIDFTALAWAPTEEVPVHPKFTFVEQTFPILFQLAVKAASVEPIQRAQLMSAILKCWVTVIQHPFPPALGSVEVFEKLVPAVADIIVEPIKKEDVGRYLKEAQNLEPIEENVREFGHQYPAARCQKWAMRLLNRLFDRFCRPAAIARDQPHLKPVALLVEERLAELICQKVMILFKNYYEGHFVARKTLATAYSFMRSSISFKRTFALIKQNFEFLAFHLTRRILLLDNHALQKWEEDPDEYIRMNSIDSSDIGFTAFSAQQFLANLVRLRQPTTFGPISKELMTMLQQYEATDSAQRDPKEKEVALNIFGSLHEAFVARSDELGLEKILVQFVAPELNSPIGWIRFRAVWTFRKYCALTWKNRAQFHDCMKAIIDRLSDEHSPVKMQAAEAISVIIRDTDSIQELKDHVPRILEHFFDMVTELPTNEVLEVLNNTMDAFLEVVWPYATTVSERLVNNFLQNYQPNSDKQPSADLGLSATLKAFSTLVCACESQQDMFHKLEQSILRVIEVVIVDPKTIFGEEILDLIFSLLVWSHTISPHLWQLLPLVCQSVQTFGIEVLPIVTAIMTQYASKQPEIMAQDRNMESMLILTKYLFEQTEESLQDEPFDPRECVRYGSRPSITLLQQQSKLIDSAVPKILAITVQRLARTPPTAPERSYLCAIFSSAVYYNPEIFIQFCKQHNILGNILLFFMHQMLNKRPNAIPELSYDQGRITIYGVSAMLRFLGEQFMQLNDQFRVTFLVSLFDCAYMSEHPGIYDAGVIEEKVGSPSAHSASSSSQQCGNGSCSGCSPGHTHASSSSHGHLHHHHHHDDEEEQKVSLSIDYLEREKKAQNREQIPQVTEAIGDEEDVPIKEIDFDDFDSYAEDFDRPGFFSQYEAESDDEEDKIRVVYPLPINNDYTLPDPVIALGDTLEELSQKVPNYLAALRSDAIGMQRLSDFVAMYQEAKQSEAADRAEMDRELAEQEDEMS